MNENATKARIKSKTGIDCVIAWLEPRDEDDFHRKGGVNFIALMIGWMGIQYLPRVLMMLLSI